MRRPSASTKAGLPAVLVALLMAASAHGAVRYADPASTTTTGACSAFAPCTVRSAIQGAVAGDEVVLRPGSYGSDGARMTLPITGTAPRLDIHGVAGQPRPRLYFSVSRGALTLFGPATVRDLEVDNASGVGLNVESVGAGPESLIERVVVSAAGVHASACALESGVIRDSVCLSGGAGGDAVYLGPARDARVAVRNVTALATGASGAGINATAGLGKTLDVVVRNSIVRGNPNLESQSRDRSGSTTIHIGYSNFVSTSPPTVNSAVIEDPAGSNQSSNPLFVNPRPFGLLIDGDYRQSPSSPTIDAGQQDPANGALDLYGGPRTVGARTDIGADEFDPPPPPPSGGGGGTNSILNPPWQAAPPAVPGLIVAPIAVRPGAIVRLVGSVGQGCAPGEQVTVISRSFRGATTRRFAGVPAIFTIVANGGNFAARLRLSRRIATGRYHVDARCGGGTLGTARLMVVARVARLKTFHVETRFQQTASTLGPRAQHLFPRTFAGSWIGTGKHAGQLFVAVTGHARRTATRLRRSLPHAYRGRLHVVKVRRSLSDLRRLELKMVRDRERIRRGLAPDLRAFPGTAYDLDLDVTRNLPIVTVAHRSAAIVDAFKRRYGAFVQVRQGPLLEPLACTRDDCGQLLRAGRLVHLRNGSGALTRLCTTGFTARELVRRVHQRLGVLSAGHCARLDDKHLDVENPYTDRGARLNGKLYQFGNKVIDVLQGKVDAEWSTDDRYPFTAGNACIFVEIPHLQYCGVVRAVQEHYDSLATGTPLCKSGAFTQVTCGTVLSKYASPNYVPGATNFVRASFCAAHGDSGSPVFYRSGRYYEAVGILSGGSAECGESGATTVFSHVEFVQRELHVKVLTWDRVKQNGVCTTPTTCTPTGYEP
jgi:hypothetical protein